MAAVNLLYVIKDSTQTGVFDVFTLITGKIKKQYKVTGTKLPAIDDALQSGTILVLASHASTKGQISFPTKTDKISASAYAELVLGAIASGQRAKVTKIVYLVCNAQLTVAAMAGRSQVAAAETLTFDGKAQKLKVGTGALMSANDIVKIAADGNGWTFTAAT